MRFIFRILKGGLWYFVVTVINIAFFWFAPLDLVELWTGLFCLCLIEWVIISKIRERIKF